jgi:hypothetical protein
MDVDSILLLSHRLPLCASLDIPTVPSANDTLRYSNKLCLPAGPRNTRTLLSRIPNFNLGRADRLSVNMFFPQAYDPNFKGMGSSQIPRDIMEKLWDGVIQPAILSAFPQGAQNYLPESGRYETDRQNETGGAARRSWRSISLPSDKLDHFVAAIASLLETSADAELAPYKSFQFLLNFQGFKSFSFTHYDDLTQSELRWFEGLSLSTTELRPLMFYKAYLKGLRRATKDILLPTWLDFNQLLQQGIKRVRRLAEWEAHHDDQGDGGEILEQETLGGDDIDAALHQDRMRRGPSLQIVPSYSSICQQAGCEACGVWVDVAVEIGCAGKVTVWNHSDCFDIV